MASVQRKIVHKQFNSPIALYSDTNIKATLDRELKSLGNGVVGWVIFYHHQFFYYSLRSKSPFLALSSSSSVVVYIFLLSVCQLLFIHTLFTLPLCIHIDSIDTFFPPPSTFTTLFIQLLSFARCLSANFFTFFIEHWLKNSIDILLCVCACVRDVKWER